MKLYEINGSLVEELQNNRVKYNINIKINIFII